jgi:hypothetical protein
MHSVARFGVKPSSRLHAAAPNSMALAALISSHLDRTASPMFFFIFSSGTGTGDDFVTSTGYRTREDRLSKKDRAGFGQAWTGAGAIRSHFAIDRDRARSLGDGVQSSPPPQSTGVQMPSRQASVQPLSHWSTPHPPQWRSFVFGSMHMPWQQI